MDRIVLQSPVGAEVVIDGRKCLYFGGNNYLGLAARPEILKGARSALRQFGLSPSASRTSTGTNRLHLELELALSAFSGTQDAVLVSSGYLAMTSLLAGVARKNDLLLVDSAAHPSVKDAVRVSGLPSREFSRDRLEMLESLARKSSSSGGRVVVVADGVSALVGQIFPLPACLDLLEPYRAVVLLDDAHAFGVLGEWGRGTAEHFARTGPRVFSCATLSKAFGVYGGCVSCSEKLARAIRTQSAAYIAATPLPAPLLGAALAAVSLVRKKPGLIARLRRNAALLKQGIGKLGLPVDDSPVPIVPVQLGRKDLMRKLSGRLLEQNILAPYLNYPGSPPSGIIRLVVSAAHTGPQIGFLLDCLQKAL